MKTRLITLAAFTSFLFWSASVPPVVAGDAMTRYNAAPGSKLRVEGTSTIHDWQAESKLIAGFLEVGPNFPTEPGQKATPGKVDVKGHAEITVSSLMSVEKNGQPYSNEMDDKMHGMLNEKQFPRISFHITDLTLKEGGSGGTYQLDAKGTVAVGGVTNSISFPATLTVQPDKKIKLSGSVPLKMSQFKIDPAGIIVKTADEVTVKFDWMLRPGKPAATTTSAGSPLPATAGAPK